MTDVVIGSCARSALYAYLNDYYHIQVCDKQPLFFEEFEDFTIFGTANKRKIWNKLKLYLGFLSLNIDYKNINKIRVSQNTIKIFDDSLLGEFKFKKCYVFDTTKVFHENDITRSCPPTFKVVDDFTINRMGNDTGRKKPILTKDDFVSRIYLYNSGRVLGSKNFTDCVAVSNLKQEEINDPDFSDTIAMFKTKYHLNEEGFLGLKERKKNKNGTEVYKKLVIRHVCRYIFKEDNNIYENSENLSFVREPTMQGIISAAGSKK